MTLYLLRFGVGTRCCRRVSCRVTGGGGGEGGKSRIKVLGMMSAETHVPLYNLVVVILLGFEIKKPGKRTLALRGWQQMQRCIVSILLVTLRYEPHAFQRV